MNHQPIFNRDVKLQSHRARTPRWIHRVTFAGLLGLAALSGLLLWGGDPELVEANILVPTDGAERIALSLPKIATQRGDTHGDQPISLASAATTQTQTDIPATDVTVPAPEFQPLLHTSTDADSDDRQEHAHEVVYDNAPDYEWHDVTVKSGDSLALIFSRLGISPRQLHTLLAQGGPAKNLKKIYPGQTIRLQTDSDNQLNALVYQIDRLTSLEAFRVGDDFSVGTVHRTPEQRAKNISFDIFNSLYVDAREAGLSDSLIMSLTEIFAWTIDFGHDTRKGDSITVLYEEQYIDGDNIGGEKIIAAEIVNRGKKHHAIRYTDSSGITDFYSLDAKSMRKTFLRSPVEFSRISSRFNLRRKHPILNRIRAHKGVDYAAKQGTPVKATANGRIVHRDRKGGYGNTIIIEHGSRYSTLYAHLSRYRSGLKTGSRVEQGQTIGYVGSTGLASGPHLHYEFRINGKHRDPLKTKLPGAKSLASRHLADFNQQADEMLAQLNLVRNIQLASK